MKSDMRLHKKKILLRLCIAIIIPIFIVIGAGWLIAVSKDSERITITAVPAESIAEKFYNADGYYLTVILDDSVIESCHLSYDRVSFKTGRNLYDKVFPRDNLAGVSLKIAHPERQSDVDLGSVLKGEQYDLCEIISVTKADNSLIDES